MKYFENVLDGIVVAVSMGNGSIEIPKERYDAILEAFAKKPQPTDTIDYRLREDLTWESYEIEPPDPDPDVDEAEALNILLGGAE